MLTPTTSDVVSRFSPMKTRILLSALETVVGVLGMQAPGLAGISPWVMAMSTQ